MRTLVTRCWPVSFAVLFGVLLGVGPVTAQTASPLGDDFIIFVNGTNVLVPANDATVVNDPADPASGNKVARFSYGTWAYSGFRWEPRTVGVDMTDNLADGDVLHLRILSSTENAGKPGVWIMLTDKTDDNPAPRADVESGAATVDHEFRATWTIPDEMHDGQWHEVSIPLPPATWQELEDAKTAGTLDPLAEHWDYPGAWSGGGYGVGPGFGTDTADLLWNEFEWTNVKNIGVMWDFDGGSLGSGGPIYLDDVYVGSAGLDISVANDPPSAMTGATFAADGDENDISWTHNEEFGGYNVYVSEDPITDVTSPDVTLIATVAFNADEFQVEHDFEVPHESFAPFPLYYAVTSLSQFGVENPDVSASSGMIANDQLPISAQVIALLTDEADALFASLSAGEASGDGFPDGLRPFEINADHSKLGDSAALPDDDDDLSAEVLLGVSEFNELWMYAEITDDVLEYGGENNNGGETWQWDSIEIGWGSYDVRDAGGSILGGSPHVDMMNGAFPDYQFRMSAFDDAAGELIGTSTFFSNDPAGTTGAARQGEVQGGGSVIEKMLDGGGNVVGWKILTLIPLDGIAGSDDTIFELPANDGLKLIPLNFALNDADGNTRESQIIWSLKGNAGAAWWNTPAQWQTVAVIGRGLATANEEIDEVPNRYALDQNYPNPFNPATTIRFSLAQVEPVTLTVYNVLGQQVATLLDGQQMTAGQHQVAFDAGELASGVYLYRLQAGASYTQTRRMLLLK